MSMQDTSVSDGFSPVTPPEQPDNEVSRIPAMIPAPAFDATPPIVATPWVVTPHAPLPTEHPAFPHLTEQPSPPLLIERPALPALAEQPPLVIARSLEPQVEMSLRPQAPAVYQASTVPQAPVVHVVQGVPKGQGTQYPAENSESQTTETAPKEARSKKGKSRTRAKNSRVVLIALRDFGIAMMLLVVLLQFFAPTIVREHSMENTLMPNEILYVAKQAYWFDPPGYNDIIIFETDLQDANGSDKTLVKRIIGVPGDRISIQDGYVFRNGEQLVEPYTKSGTTPGTLQEVTVPKNAYFVLGDNREVSRDSRSDDIGFVGKKQIRGQILFRAFPLDKFTVF